MLTSWLKDLIEQLAPFGFVIVYSALKASKKSWLLVYLDLTSYVAIQLLLSCHEGYLYFPAAKLSWHALCWI
jgi:hypothetical protein